MTQESSPDLDKAIQAYRNGELTEAAEICRTVLEKQATVAGAWHLLGLITLKGKDYDRAERYLMRAVNLKPNAWSFHLNLGAVRAAAGRPHQALLAYRAAATLQPRSADAHFNLGNALADLGRDHDAEAAYKRAIELSPDDADIWSKLAETQARNHKAEAACRSAREALDLNAAHARARETLARALVDRCEVEAAAQELNRLQSDGHSTPESTDLLGRIELTRGDFDTGWKHRRQAFEDLAGAVGLTVLWDGRSAPDNLWVEGSSEIAENVALVPLLSASELHGTQIHLRCPANAHSAIAHLNSVITLHGEDADIDTAMPLTALTSLPSLLGLSPDSLAKHITSGASAAPDSARNIGVCLDTGTSAGPLARDLAPLVQLTSLNYSALCELDDPTPAAFTLGTFDASTPAAERINSQDLVIGGDGPTIRLAAALGKPVWLLCQRFPDWAWGLDAEHSSIYPNVRLFRQARCDDWHAPVASLISELRKVAD